MLEIRKIRTVGIDNEKLQYRYLIPAADAAGQLCVGGEWSGWRDVPFIYTESPEADAEPHKFKPEKFKEKLI